MADLLDIVPSTAVDVVRIDGQRYVVRGVSIPVIASIAARFPALKSIAIGPAADDFLSRMIVGCAAAIGPIIAAGCGHPGEEQYEQRAAALLPEQQLKFLVPIFELTFPNGIGSVLEDLTRLIGGAGKAAKTVKLRSRSSRSTSPLSSDAVSRPTMQ